MEEVSIVSTGMIRPAKEPLRSCKSIRLSIYDRVMRFVQYQKRILFYNPVEDHPAVIQSLKDSLAQVLVSFYPLAGRLSNSCTEIDCSNLGGVQFSEAKSSARLQELAKNGKLQPSSFCDKLCEIGTPKWPWTPDLPLLFAQMTSFADGGISIAIGFSHQVCDGASAWHFFNSWAEIARDGQLKNLPVVSYIVEEHDMNLDDAFRVAASLGYRIKENNSNSEPRTDYYRNNDLDVKVFHLDQHHIANLKSHANFSTYEVVCGYFWKQITLARGLHPDQEAKIGVLFDSRGKFAKIPKFYLGNAIAAAIASAKAGDLTSRGLSYAAGLLHDTIVNMDETKNQAQLKFMDHVLETGSFHDIDPAAFSFIISSPRHPVYDTNFGFGKPIGVTFGTNANTDGRIYLFPSATGSGVDVGIVLSPQAMERFQVSDLIHD